MENSGYMVEFADVHLSFGTESVLAGISTGILRNRTTFIVGRSGCGKSVLTRLMVGMLLPDRGDVLVDGVKLGTMSESEIRAMRRSLALVPQAPALFDTMDILSNIAFPLIAGRLASPEKAVARAHDLLDRFDLGSRAQAMPLDLNISDAKIVSILRSMSLEPECLILDEPTTGLDAVARDAVDGMIGELGRDGRTTIVVVSHDMQATVAIADNIVFLYNGGIHLEGSPAEFLAAAGHGDARDAVDPVVAQFISGSPDGPMTMGAF
ncbi:MAG TPA: ATP-binding cassette domain-containing protein [Myxococcota bacterium]|nr:ATP-binding cassette domain-containing protein [Myxococcota bacterium]HQP95470.1 ATP-binding cassette domain-containing protein [Myxococcota bacterium]